MSSLTLWQQHYPKGIPFEIAETDETIISLFETVSVKYADRLALTCHGESLTFKQVADLSSHFAAYAYERLEFRKGDRIAIMLPNLLQFPIVLFGLLKIGCTVVNINPLYTAPEVRQILENAEAKGIIVLSAFADRIEKNFAHLPHLKHAIVSDLTDLYHFPKKQIINFIAKHLKGMKPNYNRDKFTPLKAMLSHDKSFTGRVDIKADDIAFLQYSSGTTGTPKGTILLHRNIVANVHQVWSWISVGLDPSKQIIIGALPLYHIFALTANLFTFYMAGSRQILIPNPRDIKSLVKIMKKSNFTIFNSINTLYAALLANAEFRKSRFPHFKFSLSGGMSTLEKVAKDWKTVTGVDIKEAYGLSEMSPAVTINKFNDGGYNGTVGYPLPSTIVSIRDSEGHELPVNENGEIWLKGPQKSPGYWNADKANKEGFTEDGWLKSGDIGFLDEKGRLTISGRSKNMILVSGFNVYPKEIENAILTMPEVKECAVVGIPSKSSGEKPLAFVVLEPGASLIAKDITQYCYTQLAHYKTPKNIVFVDELPKNNVGKIMKKELREDYLKQLDNNSISA
ncbi:MAG: long-chain-fatty-acid--CoA ligase [Francisellaceae bacterium]